MKARQQAKQTKQRKGARKMRQKKALQKAPGLCASMKIVDILALHPGAANVLASHGLHCASCTYGSFDTLEEGASLHGMSDDAFDSLMEDLQTLIASVPKRPMTLVVTLSGANALQDIAAHEGKIGSYLRVIAEEGGGFCLEFTEEKYQKDLAISHPEVPKLIIIASPETLSRIGGSTIDYREERFKLDLPAIANEQGCCSSEEGCSCDSYTNTE